MTWIFKISSAPLQCVASGYQGSLCISSSTIKKKVEKLYPRDPEHSFQSVIQLFYPLRSHNFYLFTETTSHSRKNFKKLKKEYGENTTSKWQSLSMEEAFQKVSTFLLIILHYIQYLVYKITVLRRNGLQK